MVFIFIDIPHTWVQDISTNYPNKYQGDKLDRFSTIFCKEDNSCDFLFSNKGENSFLLKHTPFRKVDKTLFTVISTELYRFPIKPLLQGSGEEFDYSPIGHLSCLS